MATGRTREVPVWIPPLLDLLAVTRSSSSAGAATTRATASSDVLRVWWPFAAGLGVSGVLTGAWWYPFAWLRVVLMWVGTVAVGMVLRISIHGREFKPSFVIVTTIFLGVCFFGWRLVARGTHCARSRLATTEPIRAR